MSARANDATRGDMPKKRPTKSAQLDRALDRTLQVTATEEADPYVLQGSPSTTVEKIAIKYGDAFMVSDARGDLPISEQETGLFWHGTRFLRPCDFFLEGRPLTALSHSISDEEGTCQIDLSNPYIERHQDSPLYQGTIHLRRALEIQGPQATQTFTLTSFDQRPITLRLGLKMGADFKDIFEVRGLTPSSGGELRQPHLATDQAVFSYRGRDDIVRETRLIFDPPADRAINDGVFWQVTLEGGRSERVRVAIEVSESLESADQAEVAGTRTTNTSEAPPREFVLPRIETDNVFFNRLLQRGSHDLMMMCTLTPQGLYPYGGIPWYVCPFGRDALLTSLEFLPWFPEVARGTLAFLATHQGATVNPFTEEEPGRILHEYRQGEMANCREIPFIPYYGSVDATPLFLVTLEAYVRWTNDLDFLRQLWPNAEAAARWTCEYGDSDGDSFLEYRRISEKGLVNQGWKDSWDAISYQNGTLAEPPIALCEVQGYAYAAYQAMGYLTRRLGRPAEETRRWLHLAETLRANFMHAFWWEDEQAFYLALDGAKQPCKVVGSNAGQCLWTGIVPDDYAGGVVDRMLRPDMYTEWGIRTLSSHAARYNPMSYHNGSVWPHDTAFIGAGFARYGYKAEAGKLLGNLYGLSLHYPGARLPELFCGFERRRDFGPTRYPVACAPQSWAAGAPFLLLAAALGFEPEAERGRLLLRHPELPDWLDQVDMHGMRLAGERAHLKFARTGGSTALIMTDDVNLDARVAQ
jgi:glycogen debranching enzyme